MPDSELLDRLGGGLQQLGITLPATAQERLITYLRLLERWNRAYNLTAVRDIRQMVSRHLLDSLAVLPLLRSGRLIDVGSGAGLPGIPLAMARPEMRCVLLDSNAKKTRFLIQAAAELELSNVEVVHSRVEEYRPAELFDTVTTRAFAGLGEMIRHTRHLLAERGRFVALKGANVEGEIENLPDGFVIGELTVLQIPGSNSLRYAAVIRRDTQDLPGELRAKKIRSPG